MHSHFYIFYDISRMTFFIIFISTESIAHEHSAYAIYAFFIFQRIIRNHSVVDNPARKIKIYTRTFDDKEKQKRCLAPPTETFSFATRTLNPHLFGAGQLNSYYNDQ